MQFNMVSKTHVGIIRCVLKGEKNVSWTAGVQKKRANPSQSKCKHKKVC